MFILTLIPVALSDKSSLFPPGVELQPQVDLVRTPHLLGPIRRSLVGRKQTHAESSDALMTGGGGTKNFSF